MAMDWLNEIDVMGRTPLSRVSASGRSELMTILVMQESEDQPDRIRELPEMHRAACWGFDDVLQALIAAGGDTDQEDEQGETPLHKAARLGNLEAAKCLLDHGANVNAQDCSGLSPLHWASLTGNLEMVELLLFHYADVDVRDYCTGGTTPVSAAKWLGYDEITRKLQNRYAAF